MNKSSVFGLTIVLTLVFGCDHSSGVVRAQPPASRTRQTALLQQEVARPFPSPNCDEAPRAGSCILGELTLASAELEIGGADAAANQLLRDALIRIQPTLATTNQPSEEGGEDRPTAQSFHFVQAGLLYRALRNYGPRAGAGGTLAADVVQGIRGAFRIWAASNCALSDADSAHIWTPRLSENHDVQFTGACWAAADLAQEVPTSAPQYRDGSSATDQYARWTAFARAYLRARAQFGTLEYFSPTYAPYSLSPIYNYFDFARDPGLRQAAKSYLDQWWIEWAQAEIDGRYGGAENRAYPKAVDFSPMQAVAWSYFGVGEQGRDNPALAAALASTYRPPALAARLVANPQARGSYIALARSPGLLSAPGRSKWAVTPDAAVLRIAYVTPSFVASTPVVAREPANAWNLGAVQNEQAGVVMAGGRGARITIEATAQSRGSTYNALWGLQSLGTQVVALAPSPFSRNVSGLRVYVGPALQRTDVNGWLILQGSAFSALKAVRGDLQPDPSDSNWLVASDPTAPVILQTSPIGRYRSIEAFETAVSAMPVRFGNGDIEVDGLDGAQPIRLDLHSTATGTIGGVAVDPRSGDRLKSPYLTEPVAGGSIQIHDGAAVSTLAF